MRKNVFGRQLKRDIHERKALFKGLMSSLVLEEKITTTEEKAKSIKGQIEKLVTKARSSKENATRRHQEFLTPKALQKLVKEIAPRFDNRPGGYTRIVKLGNRLSDNARLVLMEWVEKTNVKTPQALPSTTEKAPKKEIKKPTTKKTTKKEKEETK